MKAERMLRGRIANSTPLSEPVPTHHTRSHNLRDGLGLQTQGIVGQEFEHGAVAFIDLQAGLKLAVWSRADLALDAGISTTPNSPTEFSLGHNVRTKDEVDAVESGEAPVPAPA
jgi:hypothetical protein